MYQNGSELSVIIRNRTLDEFVHNEAKYTGFGNEVQTFVEGRRGSEYKIRYRNHTGKRQKIVLSVDGLNVMTGDNTWNDGYCVEPFGTVDVPGWRKDAGNVAAFEFSSLRDSYNQQNESGVATNIGVIGCRVFNEVWKPPTPYGIGGVSGVGVREFELKSTSFPFNHGIYNVDITHYSPADTTSRSFSGGNTTTASACLNATMDSLTCNYVEPQVNVGTSWGANTKFVTHTVYYDFEPAATTTLLLYYDDLKGLERRGINVRTKYAPTPNAFPETVGCPPPKRIR